MANGNGYNSPRMMNIQRTRSLRTNRTEMGGRRITSLNSNNRVTNDRSKFTSRTYSNRVVSAGRGMAGTPIAQSRVRNRVPNTISRVGITHRSRGSGFIKDRAQRQINMVQSAKRLSNAPGSKRVGRK